MLSPSGIWTAPNPPARAINWRGHSGHNYSLSEESLENFYLEGDDLYVLASGENACWVGTANDIIENAVSRARFRNALKASSSVFRLNSGALDDLKRITTAWDLENGHIASQLKLANAS